METKKNISVIVIVYNEERRIETFISAFNWSNDIIIIDKSSLDETSNIIKKLNRSNVSLISVPYTNNADIYTIGIEKAKNEWIFIVTASDVIDRTLQEEIINLINKNDFNFDVIELPFKQHVLGICDIHSPWSNSRTTILGKKKSIVVSNRVHEERQFKGDLYKVSSENGYFHHFTHPNFDILLERHLRYSKQEVIKYENLTQNKKYKLAFRKVLSAVKYLFFTKKIYRLGWDGIALGLAYFTYPIFEFLSVWSNEKKLSENTYNNEIHEILKDF